MVGIKHSGSPSFSCGSSASEVGTRVVLAPLSVNKYNMRCTAKFKPNFHLHRATTKLLIKHSYDIGIHLLLRQSDRTGLRRDLMPHLYSYELSLQHVFLTIRMTESREMSP